MKYRFTFVALIATMPLAALAAPPVTSPAATVPATDPVGPAARKVQAPDGFITLTLAGVPMMVQKDDEAWVKKELAAVAPVTRPTTMPGEMARRAVDNRQKLLDQIKADLALTDTTTVAKDLDEKIITPLQKIEQYRPVFHYMPVTRTKLRSLVKEGWGGDQFYYNRVADDVVIFMNPRLSSGSPSDEMVVPIIYEENDDISARVAALKATIERGEAQRLDTWAGFTQVVIQQIMTRLIEEWGLMPLKLNRGQQWFVLGATGVLGSRYTAMITGAQAEALIVSLASPQDPQIIVRAQAMDLLNPVDESALVPEAVPSYTAAMRARAVAIFAYWLKEKGDDALPKTIAALRAAPPADGAALVKTIKDTTGLDLAPFTGPR